MTFKLLIALHYLFSRRDRNPGSWDVKWHAKQSVSRWKVIHGPTGFPGNAPVWWLIIVPRFLKDTLPLREVLPGPLFSLLTKGPVSCLLNLSNTSSAPHFSRRCTLEKRWIADIGCISPNRSLVLEQTEPQ